MRKKKDFNKFAVEQVVDTKRVIKVVKGGRNFSFQATIVVGDQNGNVGYGMGKANEIIGAIIKAKKNAAENMIKVPIVNNTIPHEFYAKFCGSKVMVRPAAPGTGIIAGGPVRTIMDAAGIENVLTKSLGSNTSINLVKATFKALKSLRTIQEVAKLKKKSVAELSGKEEKDEQES